MPQRRRHPPLHRSAASLAAILHIEGAEAIDPDLHMLDVLYESGLRSIGPVWSRPNIFGHGVPFRYPSTPDTGPGLTDHGRALVRACNRLKIMIDLSHLNEKGFWDVAKLSDAPLVATHSNAYALCHHSRNLTDRQLAAIRESRGMVGVNFATAFIRPDGQRSEQTPLEQMVRHIDYLIEHVGDRRRRTRLRLRRRDDPGRDRRCPRSPTPRGGHAAPRIR